MSKAGDIIPCPKCGNPLRIDWNYSGEADPMRVKSRLEASCAWCGFLKTGDQGRKSIKLKQEVRPVNKNLSPAARSAKVKEDIERLYSRPADVVIEEAAQQGRAALVAVARNVGLANPHAWADRQLERLNSDVSGLREYINSIPTGTVAKMKPKVRTKLRELSDVLNEGTA